MFMEEETKGPALPKAMWHTLASVTQNHLLSRLGHTDPTWGHVAAGPEYGGAHKMSWASHHFFLGGGLICQTGTVAWEAENSVVPGKSEAIIWKEFGFLNAYRNTGKK